MCYSKKVDITYHAGQVYKMFFLILCHSKFKLLKQKTTQAKEIKIVVMTIM